jgi:D-sedoheptulose 7-phosphate isomerase
VEKITAFGNDVSFEEIFRQQMINLLHPKDLVIVISASGSSPILSAPVSTPGKKALHCCLSGFGGGKIREYATAGIYTNLKSYEQIEDLHLIILHTIVCFF